MSREHKFRKIKYAIYLMICTIMILSSCGEITSTGDTYTDKAIEAKFITIDSELSYDSNTLVVYYKFQCSYYGYLAPYYSENGKLCRYIDGKIVEIE